MAFMCEACAPRPTPDASSSHFTAWVTSYLWHVAGGGGARHHTSEGINGAHAMRLREMTISRILKIVICDPAELPREALAHLLINNCECEIVGAFARVGMAIEAANQHGADVLAIDLTGIGLRDQSRLIECLRAKCLNARLRQLIPNAGLPGSSYNGCRKYITSACRHSGRVRPRIPVK